MVKRWGPGRRLKSWLPLRAKTLPYMPKRFGRRKVDEHAFSVNIRVEQPFY
jgi:hypothetical protein